jgi:hypothetical protein
LKDVIIPAKIKAREDLVNYAVDMRTRSMVNPL